MEAKRNGVLTGNDGLEYVGAQSCAPLCGGAAPVVADYQGDFLVTHRPHESQDIADPVEHGVGHETVVVGHGPWSTEAIAAYIRRNDVKSSAGERQHLVAPDVGQLRKPMQQDEAGPPGGLKAGFERMQNDLVVGIDATRANSGWKRGLAVLDAAVPVRWSRLARAGSPQAQACEKKQTACQDPSPCRSA